MKYTTILLALVGMMATGCYKAPQYIKPGAWIMDQVPKEFPAKLQKAWLDGCQSGMGSMTNSFYRTFYRFQQDPRLRKDPEYYKIWKDTYNFCRHYTYGVIREGDLRFALANDKSTMNEEIQIGADIFNKGLLNLNGPNGQGVLFQNVGEIGGDSTVPFGQEYLKMGGGGWEEERNFLKWDLRPYQNFSFWGDNTIDGWK